LPTLFIGKGRLGGLAHAQIVTVTATVLQSRGRPGGFPPMPLYNPSVSYCDLDHRVSVAARRTGADRMVTGLSPGQAD
jgi:hypothetical protein